MIIEISKTDLDEWQKFLGIDSDGTVNLFHKIPENISGKFVPSELRKHNYKSCVQVSESLPEYSGKVFEFFKTVDNKSYWKEINE